MEESGTDINCLSVEMIQYIGSFMDPASQVYFAVTNKWNCSVMSHKSLVWWRIREVYINSDEYVENRLGYEGDWWSDFIVGKKVNGVETYPHRKWPSICYHTIIVWSSVSEEGVDDEMLIYGLSLGAIGSHESISSLGDDVARYAMRVGRLDLLENICYYYYLTEDGGHENWEGYVVDNINAFIPKDHSKHFTKYFFMYLSENVSKHKYEYWYGLLNESLRCGSPKIANYMFSFIYCNMVLTDNGPEYQFCLCRYIDWNNGLLTYERKEHNCNQHDQLPNISCEKHGKVLLVLPRTETKTETELVSVSEIEF